MIKMNKKIITIMVTILLIGIVTAGTISLSHIFNIKEISNFTKEDKLEKVEQLFELTIDGKIVEVYGYEKNNNWDENDVDNLISSVNGKVTKIEMIGVGVWSENDHGKKSFNQTELKIDECNHEDSIFDIKLNDCVYKIKEVK